VSNRFQALPVDVPLDVNGSWDRISKVLKESAEASIGFKKPFKDRWISANTKDLMTKRGKAGKHRKGRTYHALCKDVKKSVKDDQDNWYSEQATMMEEARRRNDTRTVYQCIGRISGKGKKSAINVKDDNGKLLTSKADKLKCWKDYFSGLLNKTLTDPTKRERLRNTNIRHPPMDLPDEPPSRGEIDLAIS
jgi:adenine-specific DNA methylase